MIVEREFHTRPVHQGYIEPHSATAQWSTDGTVTIWASSQGHFALRDHTAAILGVSVSRLKVIPMEIGGGFGGKGQGGCYLGAGGRGPLPEVRSARENRHDAGRGL